MVLGFLNVGEEGGFLNDVTAENQSVVFAVDFLIYAIFWDSWKDVPVDSLIYVGAEKRAGVAEDFGIDLDVGDCWNLFCAEDFYDHEVNFL